MSVIGPDGFTNLAGQAAEIARLEHDELSPEFLGFLRLIGVLNHEDCQVCEPPIYESGLVGNMWTKALDCPLCGVQIKRGAAVLVRRDYERHLDDEHFPTGSTSGENQS